MSTTSEWVLVEECNPEKDMGRRAALRNVPKGIESVVLRGRRFRRTSRSLKDGTAVFAPEGQEAPDDHE